MDLMPMLRANYERILLLAAAVFLVVCAAMIWRTAGQFAETFAHLQSPGQGKPAPAPARALEVEAAMEKLRQPPQWTFTSRSGLFVPEKHFIGATGAPTTLQTTEVHPPVPNEWIEQFNLPLADADVLAQDPDGDGFSNLEEWQSHTNPIDPNSHPPFVVKLKMKSFTRERFPLVFASRAQDTFGINNIDPREPTQFLTKGEVIRGTKFKIVDFAEKSEQDQYGTDVDVSELTLENQESGEHIVLTKGKGTISPESVANFVYLAGNRRELLVKKDQEFTLPADPEIRYKLIDVQPDKAVVVNLQKPEERIEVGLFAP